MTPTDPFWDLEDGSVEFVHQDQDEEIPNTNITDEFASADEVSQSGDGQEIQNENDTPAANGEQPRPEVPVKDSHLYVDPSVATKFQSKIHSKITLKGYRYNRHRRNKNGSTSYACEEARKGCKGRVTIHEDGTVVYGKNHDHEPSVTKTKYLKVFFLQIQEYTQFLLIRNASIRNY